MFCNTSIGATDEQKHKLEKLLKLWESKANYLASDTVEKMHQPATSYQQYQADQVAKYATEVSSFSQQTKATFEGYQAQHQAFVRHAMQQIMDLQQQKQSLEQLQVQQPQQPTAQFPPPPPPPPPPTNMNLIPLESIQANLQQSLQNMSQNTNGPQNSAPSPGLNQIPQTFPSQLMNPPPPSPTVVQNQIPPDNFILPMDPSIPPPILSQPPNGIEIPFNQPPPGFFPPPGVFPDFSKPPPGFPAPLVPEVIEDLLPSVPYYDLPAGLIVPLIKVGDSGGSIYLSLEVLWFEYT